MTREARVYNPFDYPDGILRTVPVQAERVGTLWSLTYVRECPDCGNYHVHSGSDGSAPYFGPGDTGSGLFYTSCKAAPDFALLVRLVLAGIRS